MQDGIYLDMLFKYDGFDLELCSNGQVCIHTKETVFNLEKPTVPELISSWETCASLPNPLDPVIKFTYSGEKFRFQCPMSPANITSIKAWWNAGNPTPTLTFPD